MQEGSDPWQVKAGVSDVFARSRLPRPSVETLVDLASPVLLTRIPPQLMDQVSLAEQRSRQYLNGASTPV